MREIAAHALVVVERVQRRGHGVAGVRLEPDLALHPLFDGLHAAVALWHLAKQVVRHGGHAVRLAVAAGVEVDQRFGRQLGHRGFKHGVGLRHVVRDVERGAVAQLQRAGPGAQAQRAAAGGRVGVHDQGHGLAHLELFPHHFLLGRVGGLDIEDEVGGRGVDRVLQIDGEVDADHGVHREKKSEAVGPGVGHPRNGERPSYAHASSGPCAPTHGTKPPGAASKLLQPGFPAAGGTCHETPETLDRRGQRRPRRLAGGIALADGLPGRLHGHVERGHRGSGSRRHRAGRHLRATGVGRMDRGWPGGVAVRIALAAGVRRHGSRHAHGGGHGRGDLRAGALDPDD
ncbi:hypothetical protein D9M68_694120 [compost metagenome]